MLSAAASSVAGNDGSSTPVGAELDSMFARLAPGQFEAELHAMRAPTIPFQPFSKPYVAKALSTHTNWTAKGAVTPVKNQGPHGFCGTFGRVASAEGQFFMKTGKLVSFSEQELVDCIGWDKDQFSYFSPNGFMTTADYPYNLSAYKDQDPPIPGNPCMYDRESVVPGSADAFFNATTGSAPDVSTYLNRWSNCLGCQCALSTIVLTNRCNR